MIFSFFLTGCSTGSQDERACTRRPCQLGRVHVQSSAANLSNTTPSKEAKALYRTITSRQQTQGQGCFPFPKKKVQSPRTHEEIWKFWKIGNTPRALQPEKTSLYGKQLPSTSWYPPGSSSCACTYERIETFATTPKPLVPAQRQPLCRHQPTTRRGGAGVGSK